MMNSKIAAVPFLPAYLDDIVIFSDTLENHLHQLNHVLQLVAENGHNSNEKKLFFAQLSVALLGHIFDGDGITVHPDKITAI